jgi:hypothetical protein
MRAPGPAGLAELAVGCGYGSRDFSVRDPEGNRWSGTYRGEPRKR